MIDLVKDIRDRAELCRNDGEHSVGFLLDNIADNLEVLKLQQDIASADTARLEWMANLAVSDREVPDLAELFDKSLVDGVTPLEAIRTAIDSVRG